MNVHADSMMNTPAIYRDAYCEIILLPTIPCLCHRFFHEPQDKDYVRNNLQLILELAKQQLEAGRLTPYLLEVFEGKLLPSDDVTWIRKEFLTQLWESGIRNVAYVSRNNVFSQFVMETLLEGKSPEKVIIRIFKDLDEALLWLQRLCAEQPSVCLPYPEQSSDCLPCSEQTRLTQSLPSNNNTINPIL